jgi:hypothetical protein
VERCEARPLGLFRNHFAFDHEHGLLIGKIRFSLQGRLDKIDSQLAQGSAPAKSVGFREVAWLQKTEAQSSELSEIIAQLGIDAGC